MKITALTNDRFEGYFRDVFRSVGLSFFFGLRVTVRSKLDNSAPNIKIILVCLFLT